MSEPKTKRSISAHRWILGYLMAEKAVFFPSLAALFFTAILSLGFPYFLKELVGNPTDALHRHIDPQLILQRSNQVMMQLAGVLALQAFVAFFRVQGFIRSGEAALNRLRRDLFAHLVRLPMAFFHEQRAGALSNRVAADLGVVRETLLTTVPQAVRQTRGPDRRLDLHLRGFVETLADHARQRAGGGVGHRRFRQESPRLFEVRAGCAGRGGHGDRRNRAGHRRCESPSPTNRSRAPATPARWKAFST